MYILIFVFMTANGGISAGSQEFSNMNSCLAAKATLQADYTIPSNFKTFSCVAK